MKKTKHLLLSGLAMIGALCACGRQQPANASENFSQESHVDSLSMVVDSMVVENDTVEQTDSLIEIVDAAIEEPKKEESRYVYRTLKEIELTIPNAEDTIYAAINRFSPQFKDWTYSLFIYTSNTNYLNILGENKERNLDLDLEDCFYIEKKGYVNVKGREMDLDLMHNSKYFIDIDTLIRYTGKTKTFRYRTDYPIILDGDIEYYMEITNDALVPKKKMEAW